MRQIDCAAADLVGLIVGIVETDAGQRCRTRDGYLISPKKVLDNRERSACVDRILGAGRCPGGAQHNGIDRPRGGIPTDARQILGTEDNGVCATIQPSAFGGDRHPIGTIGGETPQQQFRDVGDNGGECGILDIAVVDLEACGSAEFCVVIPCESCGGGGDYGVYSAYRWASVGDLFEDDVVDDEHGGRLRLEGHMAVRSLVVGETYRETLKEHRARDCDVPYRHKGGGVSGVAHHAHGDIRCAS